MAYLTIADPLINGSTVNVFTKMRLVTKKVLSYQKDSPYRTFFKFREDTWSYNVNYDGWWGHDTLPKLNYEESPKLYEYIMRIARKWVSPPYNVDGWRLDVAADLGQTAEYNHHFWHEFRRNVKRSQSECDRAGRALW